MKLLAKDIRNNSIEELEKKLVDAKSEMLQIRQKKQSAILKPSELRNGRRNVAVILTIIREKKYQQLLEKYKDADNIPKELKPRMNRRKRQELTKKQKKISKVGKTKLYTKGNKLIYAFER